MVQASHQSVVAHTLHTAAGRLFVCTRISQHPQRHRTHLVLSACRDTSKKQSVREANIEAAKAVADAVRTSLGPRGMDKMVSVGEKLAQCHPLVSVVKKYPLQLCLLYLHALNLANCPGHLA